MRDPSHSNQPLSGPEAYRNSQAFLDREVPRLLEERRRIGLEGLVGDLACVILNVEPENQQPAVAEFLRYTGLNLTGVFRGPNYVTAVLTLKGSADVLVRSRRRPQENPFRPLNDHPKSAHLPNTRLETFVFETPDLERYVEIQRGRGVRFVSDDIVRTDTYSFVQTAPSSRTGASYGFIQWHGPRRNYEFAEAEYLDWDLPKPPASHLRDIKQLDHVATRLRAEDRDAAILEFMSLTNHSFSFAIYVESLNSITNVTRRGKDDVALVLTTGIQPLRSLEQAGPTEKFVYNYGARTHHLAFHAERIEKTYAALRRDGLGFLVELVGGPDEGLHQTFTEPMPSTLVVNEYIHRYGGFDGYFTLSNVTQLTEATDRQ